MKALLLMKVLLATLFIHSLVGLAIGLIILLILGVVAQAILIKAGLWDSTIRLIVWGVVFIIFLLLIASYFGVT